MRLFTLCAALVGVALAAPAAGEVPGLPGRPGTLIIVGGGDTPASVQQRFVALAGGPGKARIAVFPMASTQFDEEAQEVMAELRKLHADIPADCCGGYSSNQTCEIGLTNATGLPYRSIVHLLDECSAEAARLATC